MSEPDDKQPRRRVPKDPFANLPPMTPLRPKPAPPRRARPEPEPEWEEPARPEPAVSPLVRREQPEEPRRRRRDQDEESFRDGYEEERPRHRKRAPDPEEFVEEAPRRRRRDDVEEEEPPRRRRDEEERDYPDEPRPRRRREAADSPTDKVIKPLLKVVQWIRTLLEISTVLYIAVLIYILVTIEWSAEENVYTAAMLYLPAFGWLWPLAVLAPMSLLFLRFWLLPFHLLCVAGVLGLFMKYGRHEPLTPKGPTVTVVSNNIGENHGKSINAFVQKENPDVIALQDAGGRGRQYAQVYSNYYVAEVSQFVLISKLPIRSAAIVPLGGRSDYADAACFEVVFNGRPLAIYSVHLPTPRRHLEAVKGLGLMAMLFGKAGGHGEIIRADSEKFWADQLKLASALVEHVASDRRQCIIAGDLNAPNHGVVYHLFASKFNDAFQQRGHGYGFSFPGDGRTGPWLRLDHVMSSHRLEPIYARTEEGRPSQHRAVVARFEWQ